MMVAARLTIAGRVQGVGFRAFVTREARRRGLRGWVRNRADGSVETLLIGDAVALEAAIVACGSGPALARVDRLAREAAEDDGSPDFIERATV
jgi:acylphosphatase